MRGDGNLQCPDCDGMDRRDFLKWASGIALASVLPASSAARAADAKSGAVPETWVTELYKTLGSDQRKVHCFAFDDPLRSKVSANWKITEPRIEDLAVPQQDLVEKIVRGLSSEEGFEKFMIQMGDDDGGLGSYHFAIFGEPGQSKFEFVLTGRHCTMRADGNSIDKVAFGGPMVYGHAPTQFTEKPDHPGNVFWYQARRANEVFAALDPKQRERALVEKSPREDQIQHRASGYPGLAVGEMSSDQQALVQSVMGDLLSPYRKSDVDEVLAILAANGGIDRTHLAFFKLEADGSSADIGNDGVWDIWRLEGPGFVWHFRGAPHVHTWVNIAQV